MTNKRKIEEYSESSLKVKLNYLPSLYNALGYIYGIQQPFETLFNSLTDILYFVKQITFIL
jgi:hypothetical protein